MNMLKLNILAVLSVVLLTAGFVFGLLLPGATIRMPLRRSVTRNALATPGVGRLSRRNGSCFRWSSDRHATGDRLAARIAILSASSTGSGKGFRNGSGRRSSSGLPAPSPTSAASSGGDGATSEALAAGSGVSRTRAFAVGTICRLARAPAVDGDGPDLALHPGATAAAGAQLSAA